MLLQSFCYGLTLVLPRSVRKAFGRFELCSGSLCDSGLVGNGVAETVGCRRLRGRPRHNSWLQKVSQKIVVERLVAQGFAEDRGRTAGRRRLRGNSWLQKVSQKQLAAEGFAEGRGITTWHSQTSTPKNENGGWGDPFSKNSALERVNFQASTPQQF